MDWNTFIKQSDILFRKSHDVHVEFYHLWLNNALFTWRWWVGLSLIIFPWGIWLSLRKKESSDRLLYAGLITMILSSAFDMIGIAMNLWSYPVSVFPLMPEFIPYDICIFPVTIMLCIQYCPKTKPYKKAVIVSVIGSFIFQPVNRWLGLYKENHWKDYYSFPIIIIIYLIANYFVSRNKFASLK